MIIMIYPKPSEYSNKDNIIKNNQKISISLQHQWLANFNNFESQ